jgi:hypothetical protein
MPVYGAFLSELKDFLAGIHLIFVVCCGKNTEYVNLCSGA